MVETAPGKFEAWVDIWGIDVVLVLTGMMSLVIGLSLTIAQRPIQGGVLTTGRIVDQVTKVDSEGDRATYPVIEFTDRQERTHRFENEIGGSGVGGVQGSVGQVVKVRYDPDKPTRAEWADQPGLWMPLLVVALGAVLLLIELGLVVRRVLRRQKSEGEAPHP